MKLQSIGVFSKSIWKAILEYADSEADQMTGITYIETIYTILDSKGNVNIEAYIANNEDKISKAILKTRMNILAFV